jgi:hypothetical protein
MSGLSGNVIYPGLGQFLSASMTISHGISPSVAVIEMLPQAEQVAINGDLLFTFGEVERLFRDCRADYGRAEFNESGEFWQIALFDRRWKWRFGRIAGEWNIRKLDGTIKEETERNVQELARLCLVEMGEGNWDVGGLPAYWFPPVKWDGENPAAALADLCDAFTCYVVPSFTSLTGAIVKAGFGADLPEGGEISLGAVFDLPEMPDRIGIECGDDLFQHDFELEPVGEENDEYGTIKKKDDLSYKPSGGWEKAGLVFGPITGEKEYAHARKSVWRWFRLKMPDAGLVIEGYPKPITSLDCIDLQPHQVDTLSDEDLQFPNAGDAISVMHDTFITRNKPAIVYGIWTDGSKDAPGTVRSITPTDPDNNLGRVQRIQFEIDPKHRLVKFSEPMYYRSENNGYSGDIAAPTLYLRTACKLLDPDTRAPVRYLGEIPTTASPRTGTQTQWFKHPEIVLRHNKDYPDGINLASVKQEGTYYLLAILAAFQIKSPQVNEYIGLIPAHLDGAILQITIKIDQQGTTTTIARNTEDIEKARPYRQRRAMEWQRELAAEKVTPIAKAIATGLSAVGDYTGKLLEGW